MSEMFLRKATVKRNVICYAPLSAPVVYSSCIELQTYIDGVPASYNQKCWNVSLLKEVSSNVASGVATIDLDILTEVSGNSESNSVSIQTTLNTTVI